MTNLKLHTLNLAAESIEKLAALFPSCITEIRDEKTGQLTRAIDFDQLRQELADHLVEGPRERYHLDWPGKREALLNANAPIAKTLRPCRVESVNFDNTKNLFIEGDNLDALKLLQESYLGKVKMIYIDPPYNTGSDFIYEDDFAEDYDTYMLRSNQADRDGNRLVANTEANGRFHSDWLSMLYPRLKLARNILSDDGSIFVSIGDHEIHDLRSLMNEVFGESNYINTICVKAKPTAGASGGGEDKRLKKNVEFLLVYAKDRLREAAFDLSQSFDEMDLMDHIAEMREAEKSWKYTRIVEDFGKRERIKEFVDGDGQVIAVYRHHKYRFVAIGDLIKQGRSEAEIYSSHFETVFRDTNAQSSIRTRVMEAVGAEDGLFSIDYMPRSGRSKGKILTVYYKGPNKDQIAWLKDIAVKDQHGIKIREKTGTLWADFNWNNVSKEGDVVFPNGKKPIAFVQRMLRLATAPQGGQIVLDFFSGSSSTAHAVMALNAEDQGNRRHIMVQIPEKCEGAYTSIADLGKDRIRRAGQKLAADNALTAPNLDIGFRVLKIDTSNMRDVYFAPDAIQQNALALQTDNIKENRTPEDLLFHVFVDWGVDLGFSIEQETIAGKTVYFVDGNALAACFDPSLTEDFVVQLAKRRPLRAVFRDSSYDRDSTKINVEQIFKLLSPETEVKSL